MRKRKAKKLRKPMAPGTQMHIDRKRRARLVSPPVCAACDDTGYVLDGCDKGLPCLACGIEFCTDPPRLEDEECE